MNRIQKIKAVFSKELPFALSSLAIVWQILFLYIPILIITYFSFYKGGDAAWYSLTLQHYATFFDWVYVRIIVRSLVIAGGVAIICLACAYPTAYYLAIKVSSRWKFFLLFLLTLPFWTNFLIQVYSWFFLLDRNGLINVFLLKLGIIAEPLYIGNNMFAILLVIVYCYLPFMILPLYSVLEKISTNALEASMDLGATHWQTFLHVTLPLSASGIKTGILLVFIPAFGEFIIPALIGGSKYMMVGSLISHYFLVGRDTALGASFTLISCLILLICTLLFIKYFRVPYEQSKRRE